MEFETISNVNSNYSSAEAVKVTAPKSTAKAIPLFPFGENDLTAPLNRWPAGHEDLIAIRTSIRRKK